MKKGFTLIELLAVILILGIIALIAIPTVNNILKEARRGAFKSGNENVFKSIEQGCQTDLVKGKNPTRSYLFSEGKSSNNIEIKGVLPLEGYILLDNECTISNYYLSDGKNIDSNGEDVRIDYMLKPYNGESNSIFKILYPNHYDKVISIEFINNLNIPNDAIEIKDPSISENGKIKSWLVQEGDYYHLYIGSDNKIYANYNSSYLFNEFSLVEHILLNNFDTSFVKIMDSVFRSCLALKDLNVDNWVVSNVTNMVGLFRECKELKSLNLNRWDTSNVENMQAMFYYCTSLKHLEISNFDTSKLGNLVATFNNCREIEYLDLSKWDPTNLYGASYMFENCYKLKELNLSTWTTPNLLHIECFLVRCNSLETLNIDKFITKNVTKMNMFIFECPNLKELNLSNLTFDKVEDITNFIASSDNIEKIKISNSVVANIIDDYLPTRTSLTPGVIYIINDKTNLDTSILSNKNWTVL